MVFSGPSFKVLDIAVSRSYFSFMSASFRTDKINTDKRMKILRKFLPVAFMGFMIAIAIEVKAQDMVADNDVIQTELQEIPSIDGAEIPQSENTEVMSDEKTKKDKLIQNFLILNSKYFRTGDLLYIKERLSSMDEDQIMLVNNLDYVNPTVNLVVSLLVGNVGVDRFLIGQAGWGVLKLVTLGGLGVWTIVDWFQIKSLTKKYNMKLFNEATMLM